MEVTLNLDADTLAVVQEYLEEMKYTGTPEEYFASHCDRLLSNIVKDKWEKINKNKSMEDKIADIKKAK